MATQPRQMDDESGAAGRRGVEPPEEKAESESESESEGRRSHAKKGGGEGREQAFEKPRVSKRSMRKIKVNGGNGTRMVFDEDTGEALNPLVQLMRSGLGHEYVEVACVLLFGMAEALHCGGVVATDRNASSSFSAFSSFCASDLFLLLHSYSGVYWSR